MTEQFCGINVPTPQTLQRYGLTRGEWTALVVLDVEYEVWMCPVCGKTPPSGRTVIDHYHVRGWKKMPPDERKEYVRGVVCVTCNHFVLTRYGTPARFRAAADYLEDYEKRRSA